MILFLRMIIQTPIKVNRGSERKINAGREIYHGATWPGTDFGLLSSDEEFFLLTFPIRLHIIIS
jgi:hypothetical protein